MDAIDLIRKNFEDTKEKKLKREKDRQEIKVDLDFISKDARSSYEYARDFLNYNENKFFNQKISEFLPKFIFNF